MGRVTGDLPLATLSALERYRDYGLPPGGFLRRVLENRPLFHVVGFADHENAAHLKAICRWVYNELPIIAWGSEEHVEAWIERKNKGRKLHAVS